jgi:hypothetical protein
VGTWRKNRRCGAAGPPTVQSEATPVDGRIVPDRNVACPDMRISNKSVPLMPLKDFDSSRLLEHAIFVEAFDVALVCSTSKRSRSRFGGPGRPSIFGVVALDWLVEN